MSMVYLLSKSTGQCSDYYSICENKDVQQKRNWLYMYFRESKTMHLTPATVMMHFILVNIMISGTRSQLPAQILLLMLHLYATRGLFTLQLNPGNLRVSEKITPEIPRVKCCIHTTLFPPRVKWP